MKKQLTLEESFEKLDETLAALEGRNITLEKSFELYQKGMQLVKNCNEQIDLVEKKMQVINEEGELSDF